MLQKLRSNNEGFTLIELMIVIAIIGILAAIAIPNFVSYRRRGYNAAANSDVKNAYTAAQAYFTDQPSNDVSTTDLEDYGYKATDNVTLTIFASGQDDLNMSTSHASGDKAYEVDSAGSITARDLP